MNKSPGKKRLIILISGKGGLMQKVISLCQNNIIPGEIDLVISSSNKNLGINIARKLGVEVKCLQKCDYEALHTYSERVWDVIQKRGDIFGILLLGWLPILEIPDTWKYKVINAHPSLLPCFGGKGMTGKKVHASVVSSGCRITGFTYHFADNNLDTGLIIHQSAVVVKDDDSVEDIEKRVIDGQHDVLKDLLNSWLTGKIIIKNNRVFGAPPSRWYPAMEKLNG